MQPFGRAGCSIPRGRLYMMTCNQANRMQSGSFDDVGWHRNLFPCDVSHKRFRPAEIQRFSVGLLQTSSAQVREPELPLTNLNFALSSFISH